MIFILIFDSLKNEKSSEKMENEPQIKLEILQLIYSSKLEGINGKHVQREKSVSLMMYWRDYNNPLMWMGQQICLKLRCKDMQKWALFLNSFCNMYINMLFHI